MLEALSGYLLLATRMLQSDDPAWCDAWNLGPMPGQELPVARLVEVFLAAWRGGEWRDASSPNQPHEAAMLRLTIDKALGQLGWQPVWEPAEAIARTARWYRRFYDRSTDSMLEACLEDIAAYETACRAAGPAQPATPAETERNVLT